jgi:hypothetical protein
MDCEDNRLSREAIIAHEMVDDGNDIYRYAPMYTSMTKIDKPESGHEWTGSTTRVEPYFVWATQTWEDTREEFLPPITVITDRIFELNMDMPPNSMVCQPATTHAICMLYVQTVTNHQGLASSQVTRATPKNNY